MPFDPRFLMRHHAFSWRYAHHLLFPPRPPHWFPGPSRTDWRWARLYGGAAVFWVLYHARTDLPQW